LADCTDLGCFVPVLLHHVVGVCESPLDSQQGGIRIEGMQVTDGLLLRRESGRTVSVDAPFPLIGVRYASDERQSHEKHSDDRDHFRPRFYRGSFASSRMICATTVPGYASRMPARAFGLQAEARYEMVSAHSRITRWISATPSVNAAGPG
jgi:hypothetical protein